MLKKDELCVATITLARSAEEESLLRVSLQALSRLGIPVFVTDGGSQDSFLDFIRSLPNFVLLSVAPKGVYAQAKNSLTEAAKTKAPFIFYSEPDKEDFFTHHLPQLLEQWVTNEHTGVIMASRTQAGFSTFPAFQQFTETTINVCCEERIGLKADYCYGPFLLNKKLVPVLNEVEEDMGWGWRPFVFNAAHKMGFRVSAIEKDFFCPEAQRQDSAGERLYRMKQLEQNIRGLVISAEANVSPTGNG